jgi:Ca-activated chloride channel homolog
VTKAIIQEKQQAQRTYDKAKREQKSASLLQQHRPNVFQMNVANIPPGEQVQVKLRYSEKLVPTQGVYEFVLPTVVGPRYTNGSESQGAAWASNPYLQGQQAVQQRPTLDFLLKLDSGLPVQGLTSPSHKVSIQFHSPSSAEVTLRAEAGQDEMNRDLIVQYRLADKAIHTGLLLHQGEEENYLLLNVQPPLRVVPSQIPARDYLFVLDVSGSMAGFPLDTAKALLRNLLTQLRAEDRFNVLLFAGASQVLSEQALPAQGEALTDALKFIDQAASGGGTELLPAMQRALAMPSSDDRARSLVVVTDGYVSVEKEVFDLIREHEHQASVFVMGIGTAVNRHLVEGMARMGRGEAFVITDPTQVKSTNERLLQYILSPVLTNIQVQAEGLDMEPVTVPVLFADRPIEVVTRWRGKPEGKIRVTGKTAAGDYEQVFDIAAEAKRSLQQPALRPLWARERARELGDYGSVGDSTAKEKLTALGLKYELLTEFTSFVAVDEQPQQLASAAKTVVQPVSTPLGHAGAATSAVSSGSTPEPNMSLLCLLGLLALALHRHRAMNLVRA